MLHRRCRGWVRPGAATSVRALSMSYRDRLPMVARKRTRTHEFEGSKLASKADYLVGRRNVAFREERMDWTRLLMQAGAHTRESLEYMVERLPEAMRREMVVYEILLSVMAFELRHPKLVRRKRPVTDVLCEMERILESIPDATGSPASYTAIYLTMDAHCSTCNWDRVSYFKGRLPDPCANDFIQLIMLFNAMGETTRCQSLLQCMNNLRLPVDTRTSLRLAVHIARNSPATEQRRQIVENLIFSRCRRSSNRVLYGHAAQALLHVSVDPSATFAEHIQPSAFTYALLLKRLASLSRFDQFARHFEAIPPGMVMEDHDCAVIASWLARRQQFDLCMRLAAYRSPSLHTLTTMIWRAGLVGDTRAAQRFASLWPAHAPKDAVALSAVARGLTFDFAECSKVVNQATSGVDGLLYSRLFYACKTAADLTDAWRCMLAHDVVPDVIVSIAIRHMCLEVIQPPSDMTRHRLYAELLSEGVMRMKATGRHWPALLDAVMVVAGKCSAFDAQWGAYYELRRHDIRPTGAAITEAVGMIYKEFGAQQAVTWLHIVERDTCRTFRSPRNRLLRLAAIDADAEFADRITREMAALKISPSLDSWNSLLMLHQRRNDWEACRRVFDEMRNVARLTPNAESWTALLHVCAIHSQAAQCGAILEVLSQSAMRIPLSAIQALEKAFGGLWLYEHTRGWNPAMPAPDPNEAALAKQDLERIRDIMNRPWTTSGARIAIMLPR